MAHHRCRRTLWTLRGCHHAHLFYTILRSLELGEKLNVPFHAAHLQLHIVMHFLPLVYLSLELFDFRTRFVPTGRCTVPISFAPLLFAPFRNFILRHGRDGSGGIEILGLIEKGGLFLSYSWLAIFGNLALFGGGGVSCGGGHL